MNTAITFLLLLTLTGSPAATLTCVAACASAHRMDMDMGTSTDMGNDAMMTMVMPASHHVADVMESCGTMSGAILAVRDDTRAAVTPVVADAVFVTAHALARPSASWRHASCTTLPLPLGPSPLRVLRL